MLRDLYKYLFLFLPVIFASACEEVLEPDQSQYISFEVSELVTKGSNPADTSMEFAIWIFNGNSQTPYISGDAYRLKYDEDSNSWRFYNVGNQDFEDIKWKEGKHDFFAYSIVELYDNQSTLMTHPEFDYYYYSSSSANFRLPALNMNMADPSDASKKNYFNDLLRASASHTIESAKDCTPVSLEFNHVFASLKFTVNNNTDELKNITKFEISNIKIKTEGNTVISSNANYDSYSSPLAGSTEDVYSAQEFEVPPRGSCVAFGTPVMVWPQEWAYDNKPQLTITANGTTTVTDVGLGTASTQSWSKGVQYDYVINLNTTTPPVIIEPSELAVEHVWENELLTGSKVRVNLGLTEEQRARVTNLTITLSKGDIVYKSYSIETVTNNIIEFDSGGDKYYIPSGTYDVTFTYNDGIAEQEVIKTVTSTTPVYNFTYVVSATETSCTIHSAKVNIAERVLKEVPLQPHASLGAYLRVVGNNYNDITSAATKQPEFISSVTLSASPTTASTYNRQFTIINYTYFDGLKDQKVTFETLNVCEEANISAIIFVTQYSRGDQVVHCNNMTSDALYLIQNQTNTSYYLSVAENGRLGVSTITSTDDIPIENVLQFDVDANKDLTIETGYYHESYAGVFRSAMNMKYMNTNTGYPYFDQSEAANGRYVKCADGWGTSDAGSSTGSDICFTDNYVLVYGTYPYFTTPTGQWKWHIYKVNANKKSF